MSTDPPAVTVVVTCYDQARWIVGGPGQRRRADVPGLGADRHRRRLERRLGRGHPGLGRRLGPPTLVLHDENLGLHPDAQRGPVPVPGDLPRLPGRRRRLGPGQARAAGGRPRGRAGRGPRLLRRPHGRRRRCRAGAVVPGRARPPAPARGGGVRRAPAPQRGRRLLRRLPPVGHRGGRGAGTPICPSRTGTSCSTWPTAGRWRSRPAPSSTSASTTTPSPEAGSR